MTPETFTVHHLRRWFAACECGWEQEVSDYVRSVEQAYEHKREHRKIFQESR